MTQAVKKPKVLVIVGPTSSGKSELAVICAKKMNGQVVSADSRQIYKNMDIGSGKVNAKPLAGLNSLSLKLKPHSYKGIIHYGLNIASPKTRYSVAQFQKYANSAIKQILKEKKLPIICGGTGHWVDAVVLGQNIPEVKPNLTLRNRLEKKSTEELFSMLEQRDQTRAKTIDKYNRRRLIRALEIIQSTGKPVPVLKHESLYDSVWIGINSGQKALKEKINNRLKQRVKAGMLLEVKKLRKQGVSWKKLESFGLEYKYCSLLLQNKINKKEFERKLLTEIVRYAKRQMTWFKKNTQIHWTHNQKDAARLLMMKAAKF